MTALNFSDDDDVYTATIRALAQDAYDLGDERLDFSDALEEIGEDDELHRAIEELGEDEAAELYEDAYDAMENDAWTDY